MVFACERCGHLEARKAVPQLPVCSVATIPATSAKKSVKVKRCDGTMFPVNLGDVVEWMREASRSATVCAEALDESRGEVARLERENAALWSYVPAGEYLEL